MRRWLVGLIILASLLASLYWVVPYAIWRSEEPIRVGILHSQDRARWRSASSR